MTGTEGAQPARDVAEALTWFRENYALDRLGFTPLGPDDDAVRFKHAATIVRAALAATTETHVEYRVTTAAGRNIDRLTDPEGAAALARGWERKGLVGVRIESRQVSITRTETPWKAEQT